MVARFSRDVLVGRPDSNAIAARLVEALPVTFGPSSFVLRGETYAHPATALIVAGANPLNRRRYEVVLFAGLGAEATWRCVQQLGDRKAPPGEAWLWASGSKPLRLVASPARSEKVGTEAAAR